jgi:hypothetical protein
MDVVQAIHLAPAEAPTEFEYFQNQLINEPVEIISLQRL